MSDALDCFITNHNKKIKFGRSFYFVLCEFQGFYRSVRLLFDRFVKQSSKSKKKLNKIEKICVKIKNCLNFFSSLSRSNVLDFDRYFKKFQQIGRQLDGKSEKERARERERLLQIRLLQIADRSKF